MAHAHEQHKAHDDHQQRPGIHHDTTEAGVDGGLGERNHRAAARAILVRILGRKSGADRRDVGARLLDGYARPQAPGNVQEQRPPRIPALEKEPIEDFAVHRERHPQLGSTDGVRPAERFRRHSDHGERAAVDGDRTANDARFAAEAALPEPVAQHCHLPGARGRVLFRHESASKTHRRAEHVEVVAGNDLAADDFGLSAATGNAQSDTSVCGKRLERLVPIAVVLEIQSRGREQGTERAAAVPLVGREHRDEVLRLGHRERPQEHFVDQTEDQRVGANAKTKRQRSHQREDWITREESNGETDVGQDGHRRTRTEPRQQLRMRALGITPSGESRG